MRRSRPARRATSHPAGAAAVATGAVPAADGDAGVVLRRSTAPVPVRRCRDGVALA